jgi:hypothetical protein
MHVLLQRRKNGEESFQATFSSNQVLRQAGGRRYRLVTILYHTLKYLGGTKTL